LLRYIVNRLLSMIPTLLLISILVFLITYLIPGDPSLTLLGMEVNEHAREVLRTQLGLDKPVYVRYGLWLLNILRGDLGQSIFGQFKVSYLISRALPVSLELMLLTMMIALIIAIPAAILSAVKKNSSVDMVVTIASFVGLSLPAFWLAIMLIYLFAVNLKLLPASGFVRMDKSVWLNLRSMILPSVTLGIVYSTGLMRFLRAGILDVLNEDYILTARMKGVVEWIVLARHVFKNAMIPFITVLGLEMAWLMGGSVLIENVFALPGMGRLALNAILQRDYMLIQGIALVMALLFLTINLAVDILYAFLDPRVRLAGKA
jgi:peptide/nickel transport system permease protein